MKNVLAILLLIVVVVLAAPLVLPPGEHKATPGVGMPWEVTVTEEGASKVFGLKIGASTLGEARQVLGADAKVAIVAAPGELGQLEAYFEQISLGMLTGRMVATAAVPQAMLTAWRERAAKGEYMESTTRKFTLAEADLPAALQAPVAALSFIPSAQLDEATVISRFGQPAERVRTGETLEHFLYPEKGLALTLDAKGKEVLQYVAPREFARLREPLLKARQEAPKTEGK